MKTRWLLWVLILCLPFGIAANAQSPLTISHDGPILRVTFSTDGQQILSWGGNAARVWDVQTGELLLDLQPTSTFTPEIPGVYVAQAQWNVDETIITTSVYIASHTLIETQWDANTGRHLSNEEVCEGTCGPNLDTKRPDFTEAADGRIVSWSESNRRYDECRDTMESCTYDAQLIEPDGTITTLTHGLPVHNAFWKPDGTQLATATLPYRESYTCVGLCESVVSVWQIDRSTPNYGELLYSFTVRYIVWNVTWNEDDTRLLVWSDGLFREAFAGCVTDPCQSMLYLYNIESGVFVWDIDLETLILKDVYLSPDETGVIALPQDTDQLLRFDAATGEHLATVDIAGDVTGNIDLVYSPGDTGIQLWNRHSGALEQTLIENKRLKSKVEGSTALHDLLLKDSENAVVAVTDDNTVYVWNPKTWDVIYQKTMDSPVSDVDFDAGGSNLVVLVNDADTCIENCIYRALVIDVFTGETVFTSDQNAPVNRAAIGSSFIQVWSDTSAKVDSASAFCHEPGECPYHLAVYDAKSHDLLFQDSSDVDWNIYQGLADNRILVLYHFDMTRFFRVRFLDISGDKPLILLDDAGSLPVFSPNKQQMLIVFDGFTRIYDVASGEMVTEFDFGSDELHVLAWSPDGRTIVVGGDFDYTAGIYGTESSE